MQPQSQPTIINARIPGYQELQKVSLDHQNMIADITSMNAAEDLGESTLDIQGDWLSLGGVDLQINGGLGVAFPELKQKHVPKLQQICQYLWQEGIDAFLPTIVTTSIENVQRALAVIDDFMAIQADTSLSSAKILGAHLEGPFLNFEKRGAHPAQYLLTPTRETVDWVLGDYAHVVKLMTLAPELNPNKDVIPYLRSLGICVSLGHSQANETEAAYAFEQGASMVTHAFNAMPPLHHRYPGLLGAGILDKRVYCGLIADGQHVSPMMMDLLLRCSDYDNGIFLVSDALSPIGLPDGIYPWDDRQIEVSQGTARLASGTLAGTTLPLLVGVENLVKIGNCPIGKAIALATESPRKAIGLRGISPGVPANLLRWNWDKSAHKLRWQRLAFH